jgi:hypothetical protein
MHNKWHRIHHGTSLIRKRVDYKNKRRKGKGREGKGRKGREQKGREGKRRNKGVKVEEREIDS